MRTVNQPSPCSNIQQCYRQPQVNNYPSMVATAFLNMAYDGSDEARKELLLGTSAAASSFKEAKVFESIYNHMKQDWPSDKERCIQIQELDMEAISFSSSSCVKK